MVLFMDGPLVFAPLALRPDKQLGDMPKSPCSPQVGPLNFTYFDAIGHGFLLFILGVLEH
jgi:hypothetical protein